MKRLLLGLAVGMIGYAVLGVLHFQAFAEGWKIEAINKTIEQVNFSVDRGCSGTLISINPGLILTNYHCIDGQVSSVERDVTDAKGTVRKVKFRKYEDVPVSQKVYDGFTLTGSSNYVAEIVAEAKTKDLALLRIKGKTHHTFAAKIIPDGQTVSRGERIYIVGNPMGNDGTLIEGIVSNANRSFDFPWTDGARLPMLQVSGGMAGGNSGGSLWNADGLMIGIPSAGYNGINHLGFAIPMEIIKPFLRENCFGQTFDPVADDEKCRAEKAKEPKDKE